MTMRYVMKRRLAGVLAPMLLLASASAGAAPDPQQAQEMVESTTRHMLDVLRTEARDGEVDPALVRDKINEIIRPRLDFLTMAKLAVGRHWRDASDDQKRALVNEFRELLIRTYAQSLAEYNNQELKFLPLQPGEHEDRVKVRSRLIQANGPEIPIEYSARYHDGEWTVYDIVIDGVSLVTTYRSSFSSQIEQKGIAGLIDSLRQKNAANEIAS